MSRAVHPRCFHAGLGKDSRCVRFGEASALDPTFASLKTEIVTLCAQVLELRGSRIRPNQTHPETVFMNMSHLSTVPRVAGALSYLNARPVARRSSVGDELNQGASNG